MKERANAKQNQPDDQPPQEYDSPWKEILAQFFQDFLAFFFPDIHTAVDWSRGFEFLDTELQKIAVKSPLGRRLTDKLVKVCLLDGREVWVLIHVEVQGKREKRFAMRMFVYHYRIFESSERKVVNLAILTDDNARWRPSEFSYDLFGTGIRLKFRSAKLIDYAADWVALEANPNPFAVVVMAHLKAMETRCEPLQRYRWKLELLKGLHQRGYDSEEARQLIRFIDWVMMLPGELEDKLEDEITQFEEERKMEYVTSFERIATRRGEQKGLEQGLEQGLERGLEQGQRQGAAAVTLRFLRRQLGELKPAVVARVEGLSFELLELLSEAAPDFASTTDLNKWLREHASRRRTAARKVKAR